MCFRGVRLIAFRKSTRPQKMSHRVVNHISKTELKSASPKRLFVVPQIAFIKIYSPRKNSLKCPLRICSQGQVYLYRRTRPERLLSRNSTNKCGANAYNRGIEPNRLGPQSFSRVLFGLRQLVQDKIKGTFYTSFFRFRTRTDNGWYGAIGNFSLSPLH